MKKITIVRHGVRVQIEAPEDKEMTINENALTQGILAIGEYGPSGVKIANFADWNEVWFHSEEHGYKITDEVTGAVIK